MPRTTYKWSKKCNANTITILDLEIFSKSMITTSPGMSSISMTYTEHKSRWFIICTLIFIEFVLNYSLYWFGEQIYEIRTTISILVWERRGELLFLPWLLCFCVDVFDQFTKFQLYLFIMALWDGKGLYKLKSCLPHNFTIFSRTRQESTNRSNLLDS